eukprot:TRINITY_DN4980_c0_g2_i1.p1 TRINITY_DN4980_c0_g2~~TRINITY_DN4980_c0_g2_i1.p1  ORF type:complete len:1051 (+),score=83.85 TRINITY_DN4980_c0_g2_i1:92-3244(+)
MTQPRGVGAIRKQMHAFVCVGLIIWSAVLFRDGFLRERPPVPQPPSPTATFPPNASLSPKTIFLQNASHRGETFRQGRVVISVVDGARMDVVAGQMQFAKGRRGTLFESVADAPTTTPQRIHALGTGSLPVFGEWAAALGASDACAGVDRSSTDLVCTAMHLSPSAPWVLAGDPVWVQRYPHRFAWAALARGLDVRDLHTADSLAAWLLKRLAQEDGSGLTPRDIDHEFRKTIQDDQHGFGNLDISYGLGERVAGQLETAWSVAIAHFLGVDHAAHAYDYTSPHTISKVKEIDKILDDFLDSMQDDTYVLILGDHGATLDGNHGGDTRDEVSTFLYATSKSGWPYSFNLTRAPEYEAGVRTIRQIDITSTLALLMGLPIPSGNVGGIIPELLWNSTFFPLVDDLCKRSSDLDRSFTNLHVASQIVVNQTFSYITNYHNSVQRFDDKILSLIINIKSEIDGAVFKTLYERECINSQDYNINLVQRIQDYFDATYELCRLQWATFDISKMISGLIVGLLSIFIYLVSPKQQVGRETPSGGWLRFYIIPVVSLFAIDYLTWEKKATASYLGSIIQGDRYLLLSGICASAGCVSVGRIGFQLWRRFSLSSQKNHSLLIVGVFAGLWTIRSVSMFSNSFILQEPKILRYLLSSGLLFAFLFEAKIQVTTTTSKIRACFCLLAVRMLACFEYSGSLGDHDIPIHAAKNVAEVIIDDVLSYSLVQHTVKVVFPLVLCLVGCVSLPRASISKKEKILQCTMVSVVGIYYTLELLMKFPQEFHGASTHLLVGVHVWLPRLCAVLSLVSLYLKSCHSPRSHRSHIQSFTDTHEEQIDLSASSGAYNTKGWQNVFTNVERAALVDERLGIVMSLLWIVGGPESIWASILSYIIGACMAECFQRLFSKIRDALLRQCLAGLWTVLWLLLIGEAFFATKHAAVFHTLQMDRAMTGLHSFHGVISGALLWANTWSLVVFLVGLYSWHTRYTLPSDVHTSVLPFVMLWWLALALACLLLRRHLMVWGVFAPRFLFGTVELLSIVISAAFMDCWVLFAPSKRAKAI